MNKLIVIFFLIFSQSVFSQNLNPVKIHEDISATSKTWLVKGFYKDEIKLWSSPLRITGKRLCFWVPVIGATMIAMANDEKIYSNFKQYESKHEWVSKYSPKVTQGGENHTVLAVSGLFYLGGLIFNDDKSMQTGILGVEALGHAGLIVTVGKLITGRQRPSYGKGKDYWHWFPSTLNEFGNDSQSKYDAFPSGHSIAAWSLATVLAKQYQSTVVVPILAYAVATGVALSRITQDAHWMSDVIIGSALGYTIGNFVVKERKNTHWTLFPTASNKNVELTSLYKF